ncbi:MAG: hypothetical protein H6525_01175 [Actinobacteria bacterium]|nr:hypothetical protein [Actinomycetota bacterium]
MAPRHAHGEAASPNRRRYLLLLVGLVLGGLITPTVVFATSFPADSASLGAGTDQVPSCGTLTGISYRSGYSGGRYQITSIEVAAISAGCQGQPFKLTLFDTADGTAYSELVGVLPNAPTGSIPVAPGVGPDLAGVESTVGLALVTTP